MHGCLCAYMHADRQVSMHICNERVYVCTRVRYGMCVKYACNVCNVMYVCMLDGYFLFQFEFQRRRIIFELIVVEFIWEKQHIYIYIYVYGCIYFIYVIYIYICNMM